MADTTVTIALGDPQASSLGSQGTLQRHPVGMDFYKREWPVDRLGQVRYLQGENSFDIPRVSEVMGSADRDHPQRGIYAWDVSAFPMDGERVPHLVARNELFRLFSQMRNAGWTPHRDFSEPRLKGAQALRYCLDQGGDYPLDPDYVPSMDDWMRINLHLPYWQLWANGTYLLLRVMDEPALRNPEQPGVYLFAIEIDSEASNFRQYFKEVEDMRRWRQLIPAEIERLRKVRASKEAELARQGYVIDTSYEDPPILGE